MLVLAVFGSKMRQRMDYAEGGKIIDESSGGKQRRRGVRPGARYARATWGICLRKKGRQTIRGEADHQLGPE